MKIAPRRTPPSRSMSGISFGRTALYSVPSQRGAWRSSNSPAIWPCRGIGSRRAKPGRVYIGRNGLLSGGPGETKSLYVGPRRANRAKPGLAGESDPTTLTDYNNLAALRAALTDDDPDRRATAYGAVYELDADVKPSDVLATNPSEETVQALVDGGVIPSGSANGATGREQLARVVELLERLVELAEQEGAP